ncbi:peroxin 8 [Drepanopeziza brunnea f. sp. 'multigermtubi' MB_m1]|uniref:Peroxin 8 n=1 Tax=Marssonina brunnea f. sp. multigermtubi (strain MB_m1) TaxID=1072389 RepID=K1WIY9_MARBU|nr:peroxin 8 [Drepanopeziza brunnea f. sp. 'multigermtubi' MB_m1]EKD17605.1 peroxin 8 [Drepanopeziza brunnea f. sp. 'multigermtubi' MB_m1]
MPADRLLTNVLRAYQSPSDPVQVSKILSTTTSLLTTLSNPLNVTLLTSHLLTAPAIWNQVDGLNTSLRIISVFNTAAITVHKHQAEGHSKPYDAYQPRLGGGIATDDWARAVVKGLDERTPRWQHVLVLCGLLIGMEGQERQGLSRSLRTTLENAMVTAVNLALESPASAGATGSGSVVLALNHAFPLLSDGVRTGLNYDILIMPTIKAMVSADGYQEGYFLQAIDYDVEQASELMFDWPARSASFLQIQRLSSKPIVASMGPLSRLVAHCVENVRNPQLVVEIRDYLLLFTTGLLQKWQGNKLSEIDPSEESTFLTSDTLRITFPALWHILKTVLFATVVILRSVIGRTLIDPVLASAQLAPVTASQTLLILSNLHFISSRAGSNAFSAYTFVNLTSIDILTRFPTSSLAFLRSIYPLHAGQIPSHPLQRNHDLFYLNTAEHFTLCLKSSDIETLIVIPCTPYLSPTANAHLLEIFEAAHSSMLAVLASPQNEALTTKMLPLYVESLFTSFPRNLSPRQFRFAFKALIQICTPPNPLSRSQPLMAETLLELLHHRALHAPTAPLPPSVAVRSEADATAHPSPLSEQAVLLLTLLDALPNVTLEALESWLPLTADLLNAVPDPAMREECKRRFWEVLEGGEMDVERSAVCVAWWGTRGGRERVLFGEGEVQGEKGPWMSGGLGGGGRESRL